MKQEKRHLQNLEDVLELKTHFIRNSLLNPPEQALSRVGKIDSILLNF